MKGVHKSHCKGNPANILKKDEDTPTILTGIDIDDGPFTLQELKKVKSSLKQGKSAGAWRPDGVPPKVLKNCELNDLLHGVCNRALTIGKIPSQKSASTITPVPKSRTLTKGDDHCGISLKCIFKLLNRMIQNQIRKTIDPKLRYKQCESRGMWTTVAQIFVLGWIS